MEKRKALFIAATGQNVGKTTTCLGLLSGLKKKYGEVGFMKPVGQEHVEVDGIRVDKDVVLFKNYFQLEADYKDMSPVLFPRGFTRDYLDGKINENDLSKSIQESFSHISKAPFTVVEGTGHVGVGSIVNLCNAQVAKTLNLDMIIIASGGLGSTFDELALNKVQCDQFGVNIVGVILNRVLSEKMDMIKNYKQKALDRWNIPLLGCIPYNKFLSTPSLEDLKNLLKTKLLSGETHKLRHFKHMRLVATSAEIYRKLIVPSQLIITPASREDIILTTLTKFWDMQISQPKEDLECGMILTGSKPPSAKIIAELKKADIPALYAPLSSYETMKKLGSYIAKIQAGDLEKILKAIHVVENHINFDHLCDLID